ncbi:nicotinate-nucleotide--dimethylbenzimidazole phosphoribosyltransferase, partial [Streptomyces sp. NPDC006356]
DPGVKVGEGAGGLLALPMVQAAAALAAELPEKPQQPEKPEESEKPEDSETSAEEERVPEPEGDSS